MDAFDRRDIETLVEIEQEACVSIYLPTIRAGEQTRQNAIRLKTLLAQGEEELIHRGVRPVATRDLLRAGRELLDDVSFWREPADGLVLFAAPALTRAWRLPLAFDSRLWLGNRFYLKPLWPLVEEDGSYFVLAVSQNRVRLFKETTSGFAEVPAAHLPTGLRDALNYEHPEGMIQVHSGQRQPHHKEGGVFTGQGGGLDDKKEEIVAYFRQIDAALKQLLRNQTLPLVFAGVDYLFPIYRLANTYTHLLDTPVDGNPDYWPPHELRERSRAVAAPHLQAALKQDLEHYRRAEGSPRASSDVAETVRAAFEGRIDALFVAADGEIWGNYDPTQHRVELTMARSTQSLDLLDVAATATFRQGGRVHVSALAEIPSGQPVAAVLRYGFTVVE